MKNKIFTLGGELENLTINQKEEAEKTCANLVNIFQRSSSCVEGRNGVLSFRHHELHNITDRKRKVLTIIHNFFIQRSDGTTAAERFFEKKPRDLFQKILESVSIPPRPRSPLRKVMEGSLVMLH